MIFAAGRGTRMAPLTNDRPKPLVPVNGRPLLDHALDLAEAAGIRRIVVNTHYLAPMVEQHLATSPVTTINEEVLLDTGGGLRNARGLLGNGPVLTLNSDAVWSVPTVLTDLLTAWRPGRMRALLALVPPDRASGHKGAGDFTMEDQGHLTRGPGLIYTGAQIIDPTVLDDIPNRVFSLNLAWDRLMADQSLFGMEFPGTWCDVGQPESIAIAERMLNV